jgi:hypothetical protein
LRVFVASTYEDLLDYRAAATRSIMMAGNMSEDMLYWPAADSPPLDVSLHRVRSSDLMILLIAHRYGTPIVGYDTSITELEFDEAAQLNIPILAFRIDANYAWPPPHMETEPARRAKLEDFIKKVNLRVVTHDFSTPDSLEAAIAHALANFSRQHSAVKLPPQAEARLQRVSRAESLGYSPNALIRIGGAPDGSPLLLSVRRDIPVDKAMAGIAASIGRAPEDPFFSEIISQINQQALSFAAAQGIHQAYWQDRRTQVYIPHRSMTELLSRTLFQSVLETEPADSMGRSTGNSGWRPSIANTSISGLDYSDIHPEQITSLGGANRFLCVGLDASQLVWSGGWTNAEPASFVAARPFIEEGLERLPGTLYRIRRENDYPEFRGLKYDKYTTILETVDQRQFTAGWLDLLTASSDSELHRLSHEIQVPRKAVISFVLEMMDELSELHDYGIIHGDIKPSNTLISRNGSTLIDAVGLTVGEVSPTVTVGWSPYEQLLREPLSCAADIYPIGQLLLHIVSGQMLGREITCRMPGGESSVVIDDPTVYIGDSDCISSATTRKNLSRLIEVALRTDPKKRWPTAGAMRDEIRSLIDHTAVEGHVNFVLPWGDRPSLAQLGNGEITAAWIMTSHLLTRIW